MDASTLSSKNDQHGSCELLSSPTASEEAKLQAQRNQTTDKTLASRLLSSKAHKFDSGDSDNVLNPTTESSGSDHLSDSQTSSRPSSRPRASSDPHLRKPPLPSVTPLSPETRHAGPKNEEKRWISSSLLKSSDPQPSRSDTPQPITSSSSAPSTPSAGTPSGNNQTHSFVFTSSRRPQIIGGSTLIGVVNPSINKALALPKRSSTAPKQRRKSTLTPEQIRAHALGAIHAISENSPFHPGEHLRPSTVAQMELLIQTPAILDNVDPIDRSLQRHGIEFYVNAARQGRNKNPQNSSTGAGPSSPRPQNIRSFSHMTTLESLGEDIGQMAFQDLQSPTTMSETASRHSRRRRIKGYSRYVEDESNEASFTTATHLVRREPSAGSSASSSRSKQSIDESLTSLSCFGVIGNGTPSGVFGSAVINASRISPAEQRPALIKGSGSGASTETGETKISQE